MALTPCLLVSGYLGAGKTTLINAFLRDPKGARATVLVNDFGKINIDAELIKNADGDTISLTNGCACCTIGDSLLSATNQIMQSNFKPDLVIVEASGVARPERIALLLRGVPRLSPSQIITVLDGSRARASLEDKYISGLFRTQIRSAAGLVVNRVESAEDQEFVERLLSDLAPASTQLDSLHEAAALQCNVADTASQTMHAETEPEPESSFTTRVIHFPNPVSMQALEEWLRALPETVHRAKGFLRTQEDAGRILHVDFTRGSVDIAVTHADPEPDKLDKFVLIGPGNALASVLAPEPS